MIKSGICASPAVAEMDRSCFLPYCSGRGLVYPYKYVNHVAGVLNADAAEGGEPRATDPDILRFAQDDDARWRKLAETGAIATIQKSGRLTGQVPARGRSRRQRCGSSRRAC